ncbi:MAG TPA: pitrilysin family protein [Verrucomicrobiae bacterium]
MRSFDFLKSVAIPDGRARVPAARFGSLVVRPRAALCFLGCVALLGCPTPAAPAPAGPASKVQLPAYKPVKLDNGVTLLLMERHQLPLISFKWIMRSGGGICDPAGREGVALLAARLLRKGTQNRTADQIAEAVDFVGAHLDAGATQDYASGSAEFVGKDLDLAIDLLGDMLRHPVFPQDEVAKMIKQEVDGIKEGKSVPGQVIARYFQASLFGAHPYARPVGGTETSLPRIARDDIAAFYSAHYVPDQLILAVVGDFSGANLEPRLREKLASWTSKSVSLPELVAPAPVSGRRALLVEKPDATQTFFQLGNIGLARTNPDWVPLQVVNTLFGGRFTSMINTELRIQSGLTYGARSSFSSSKVPGSFSISSYTRNDTTARALDLTLEVLNRLHTKGITQDQLQSAKAYIKGQFGPTLETNDQLASTICDLEFYGLSPDYINNYFERIDAVTLTDATRLIEKYYPSNDFALVLIGQAAVIEPAAKKLASEIRKKSITEPGF